MLLIDIRTSPRQSQVSLIPHLVDYKRLMKLLSTVKTKVYYMDSQVTRVITHLLRCIIHLSAEALLSDTSRPSPTSLREPSTADLNG